MQPPAPPDLLQVQFLSKGNRRAPGAQTGGAGSSSSSGPGPPKRGGPELGALPDSLLPRKLGQGQRSGVSRLDFISSSSSDPCMTSDPPFSSPDPGFSFYEMRPREAHVSRLPVWYTLREEPGGDGGIGGRSAGVFKPTQLPPLHSCKVPAKRARA